ncbi:MAG: hypothetical protein HZR80_13330 [Candidatus Heimdallarchaeota archaeon]
MVTQEKKLFALEGKLLTPLVSSSPFFKKHGCWFKIVGDLTTKKKPRRSYVGKLVRGERKAPIVLKAFRGFVKVTCVDHNEKRGKEKIERILAFDNLGSKRNQGFGKVKWLNYKVEAYKKKVISRRRKLRIRKGLGVNYPRSLQRLLIALMLHDFVHTEKHPSKIYKQVTILDEEVREACLNHHGNNLNDNQLIRLIKRYDSIASYITRKKVLQTKSRYDIINGEIDFQELAQEIEKRSDSAYKLYNFIYHSNKLTRIVEAMSYKKTSLRTHLLIMVNLAINEYYMGTLKIVNDRIILKEISESVTKKRNLECTKDAEKHQFPLMSNADLKNATSSMKRRLGT